MEDNKTIALLISSFLPHLGGMEIGLHNIAIRLQKRGYSPVVIAPHSHVRALKKQGWDLPYQIEAMPPGAGTLIARAPALGFALLDLYFAYLQKKHGFMFWHVTMGYPTGCAIVHFARGRKIRYLIRCAGEDIQKQPDIGYGMRLDPKLDRIITHYLSRAERLVAITESVYAEYKKMGVPDDRISRIPNGVDVSRFSVPADRAAIRARYGLSADDVVILSVGRNHPKKNYKTLLGAASLLKKSGRRNIRVVCAGKGCGRLRDMVSGHGLDSHVLLLDEIGVGPVGHGVPELPSAALVDLYRAADIFAFPSLMETFGIAIVEAMAAGLPVIVGDSDGCRDIVEGGKWGMMCDPESAEDLAGKIAALMDNPVARESLSAKSRERALVFDWDSIAGRYMEIYKGVVSG